MAGVCLLALGIFLLGNTLRLEEEDILVIEGIHCLNDRISARIPKKNKFRVYISDLTNTNIDEHNRIPTSDGRLLRRMVRDARTRGYSAKDTIARWDSVRRGKRRISFPSRKARMWYSIPPGCMSFP